MANRKKSLADQLTKDLSELDRIHEEQQNIESKSTHVGFRDASRRVKLVYDGEALSESIQQERERLADEAVPPSLVK